MSEISRLGGDGILVQADLEDLNKAMRSIFDLMKDEEWHTRHEIMQAGFYQAESLRRMRQLRALPEVLLIERRKDGDRKRAFQYRLILSPKMDQEEQPRLI